LSHGNLDCQYLRMFKSCIFATPGDLTSYNNILKINYLDSICRILNWNQVPDPQIVPMLFSRADLKHWFNAAHINRLRGFVQSAFDLYPFRG
jgi:hypothetical protein